MKIRGSFSAIDQFGGVISKGDNLIVNTGKQIFLNWLTHQGFQNSDQEQFYQGKSLSSQRFLTADQIVVSNDGEQLGDIKTFWSNSNATQIKPQDAVYNLYLNFIEPIKLSGLFMCLDYLSNEMGSYNFCYSQYVISVYTSQYEVSTAKSNKLFWTLRKNYSPDLINGKNIQNMIRFQTATSVDGYIKNVRSIKIVFRNLYAYRHGNSYSYIKLKGIGVLAKEPYCNVPCVIGLGQTTNSSVSVADTSLYDKNFEKFYVTSQKCVVSDSNGESVQSWGGLQKIYSYAQLANVTRIDIIYRSRLGYQDCINREFNEIGLFYSEGQVDAIKGTNQCTKLFSHGLFDQLWEKKDNQIIDIQYVLSIEIPEQSGVNSSSTSDSESSNG